MWIVRLALQRPYTFVVMAMLIVILGVFTIAADADRHLPGHRHPGHLGRSGTTRGLSPEEMEKRIVTNYERVPHHDGQRHRAHREPVADRHRRHQDLLPARAKIEAAMRRSPRSRRPRSAQMPPGTTPPLIIRYSASNVPILQLALEQRHADRAAALRLRHQLHPRRSSPRSRARRSPGPTAASSARSWSTSTRSALYAYGLSPRDVQRARSTRRTSSCRPARRRSATHEYPSRSTAAPRRSTQLNDLPIKTVNGTTVYVRDVAHVRDGYALQTNIVHVGRQARACSCPILKNGSASTLDVVDAHQERCCPRSLATLPEGAARSTLLFDQSVFVRAAVDGVVQGGG